MYRDIAWEIIDFQMFGSNRDLRKIKPWFGFNFLIYGLLTKVNSFISYPQSGILTDSSFIDSALLA
jgi:hypothetical protein